MSGVAGIDGQAKARVSPAAPAAGIGARDTARQINDAAEGIVTGRRADGAR